MVGFEKRRSLSLSLVTMTIKETSSLHSLLFSLCFIFLSLFLLTSPTASTTSTTAMHHHYRPQRRHHRSTSKRRRKQSPPQVPKLSSWELFKNLLSCKQIDYHHPNNSAATATATKHGYTRLTTCASFCTTDDVADRTGRRLVHGVGSPPGTRATTTGQVRHPSDQTSVPSAASSRRMPLRGFSGCYECRMVVDPSRYPSARPSIYACPDCGELFLRPDALDAHQTVRHAVCELGPEDSSRNIVEIIFQSSWLKKDNPICVVDRILRIQNTHKTINRFESYRDTVKCRASQRDPRCIADGNELLRFYCTTFACTIGTRGSTSLCGMGPSCGVCSTIRNGFVSKMDAGNGLCTTATSGRAHDCMVATKEEEIASRGRRAMLVCRVIAGRVRTRRPELVTGMGEEEEEREEDSKDKGSRSVVDEKFDSATGSPYSNLDELYVFNPKAILPCFVVIYRLHQQ